jgi:hypothetical protein
MTHVLRANQPEASQGEVIQASLSRQTEILDHHNLAGYRTKPDGWLQTATQHDSWQLAAKGSLCRTLMPLRAI